MFFLGIIVDGLSLGSYLLSVGSCKFWEVLEEGLVVERFYFVEFLGLIFCVGLVFGLLFWVDEMVRRMGDVFGVNVVNMLEIK